MKRLLPVICLLSSFIAAHSFADGATWSANPISGDWNTAENWAPAVVPTDTAKFTTSSITDITVSSDATIAKMVFPPRADSFSITFNGVLGEAFILNGDGIVNRSGVLQHLAVENLGVVAFQGDATVAGMSLFDIGVSDSQFYATNVSFNDQSSAGDGMFVCDGNDVNAFGGWLSFNDESSGGNAMISINPAIGPMTGQGVTWFSSDSDAGNATIFCHGGQTGNGGTVSFADLSGPGNATLIANGAVEGLGGVITFGNHRAPTTPSTSRVKLTGQGTLSVLGTIVQHIGAEVGSIEGDGLINLGSGKLTVGRNNRSTTFRGIISGGGPGTLAHIGTGTLNLTGANTYGGETVVYGGKLAVNNTTGSATGVSFVEVKGGASLSGRGIIDGTVTLRNDIGDDSPATLAPGNGEETAAILTIQGNLIFSNLGTYSWRLFADASAADEVTVSNVLIQSDNAQFDAVSFGEQSLPIGTTFVVINNTGSREITGTFANLADGATITAGPNTLQANYEGGDGNDLTLTVVQ